MVFRRHIGRVGSVFVPVKFINWGDVSDAINRDVFNQRSTLDDCGVCRKVEHLLRSFRDVRKLGLVLTNFSYPFGF